MERNKFEVVELEWENMKKQQASFNRRIEDLLASLEYNLMEECRDEVGECKVHPTDTRCDKCNHHYCICIKVSPIKKLKRVL